MGLVRSPESGARMALMSELKIPWRPRTELSLAKAFTHVLVRYVRDSTIGALSVAQTSSTRLLSLRLSCSPNVAFSFNMPSFTMEMHAVRSIAKGDEITVAYTSVVDDAAIRQTALKPYGFTCDCPAWE